MKRSLVGVSQIAFWLAASGGLGWLALRALDWDLVRGELKGVSVSLIVLAVAVFMFASYLRAYRWQPLFITEKISTPRLFVIQNEGIGSAQRLTSLVGPGVRAGDSRAA